MRTLFTIPLSLAWTVVFTSLLNLFFPETVALLSPILEYVPIWIVFLAGWVGAFFGMLTTPDIEAESLWDLIGCGIFGGLIILAIVHILGLLFAFTVVNSLGTFLFSAIIVTSTYFCFTVQSWVANT